jgi:sodium transport system ATP-binding protein
VIEASGLKKSFGPVAAVSDVGFIARDGSVTGLLGPNGAGKSTTLRMIYTVLGPDAGRIAIDGIDALAEGAAARRRIGVLTAQPGLYRELTVRENIRYFGALQGLGGAPLARRVDELVEQLGLAECAERRAATLSQGQRVKTALARALVHSPRNVLLDEPTNGLDVPAIRTLREIILTLRAAGHCVLFSSHVMQEVAAVCDRLVVIARGRVVADATPAELAAGHDGRLEDAFVAAVESGSA